MLDLGGCLPKNLNGIRTTHTCELCGFEPKTKNKYREKQDHLVMKHFKEKIDKIFPHCRPYTCPSGDCSFTGKDKQALLRHYTGKHGILERYLREALAENGIHILPGEPGSKRRSSVSGNGNHGSPKMVKQARLIMTPPSPMDPKEFLPNTPLPNNPRQNAEELRKEVEAMMASFQPQPIETQMVVRLPQQLQLVTVSQTQSQPQQQTQHSPNVQIRLQQQNQMPERMNSQNVSAMPIKVELPQHPTSVCVVSSSNTSMPINVLSNTLKSSSSPELVLSTTRPLPSLIMTSRPQQISLPSMESQMLVTTQSEGLLRTSSPMSSIGPSLSSQPIPLEMITGSNRLVTTSSSPAQGIFISSISNPSIFMTSGPILENKEVMWGGGLGPAVVVEAADTLPITYIETADGSYAALLDAIDYDFLVPSGVNGVDAVRERQLDFCML